MNHHENMTALFEPESIAIVGASSHEGKIGHIITSNLLEAGFKGTIFPVNPKAEVILGLAVVNDIKDLPPGLDLAVICVPPKFVIPALQSLAELSVKSVVIITAGFKEVGGDGYYLEQEVKNLCAEHNIALLGPNCLGMINTGHGVNVSFAVGQPLKGSIAFFSQSGALCVAILDWAVGQNVGFSKFISLGNKAILDESDMLSYLADDPDTKVILGYIEGVENGKKFMKVARDVSMKKPIVLIKSGTTAAGAKAASSHTGAIAGSNQAYIAAFGQTGVIRAPDVASLFNLAQAFSNQPLPKGPNLAIVTNSGGPGILAADATEKSGMILSRLSNDSLEKMQAFLPSFASLYNPIDIIGDAPAERYAQTLEVVLQDHLVDAIMVLLSPTASVQVEETAQSVIDLCKGSEKPVFCCFMGDLSVSTGRKMLQDAGIPCYDFPEPAIYAIETMYKYHERLQKPAPVEVCYRRNRGMAEKVIMEARRQRTMEIVEFQAQAILKAYEVPCPVSELARTSDEAVKAANRIGYPVVMKIASPQISHKSDVDGVKVNIKTPEQVRSTFLDITSRAQRMRKDAFISGCLIQSMAPVGSKEVIVGFKRDPQFGPLILFGLGGIYVEVLKDVSFRLAPLTLGDAQEVIREIKAFPLLRGVRGEQPVDFKAIEDVVLIMSQLAMDFPEISEAEFNPVLVSPEGAIVADVRVILDPEYV